MLAAQMWQEWIGLVAMTWLVGSVAVPVITMTDARVEPLRTATRSARRFHIGLATLLLIVSSVLSMYYPARAFVDGRGGPIAVMRIFIALLIVLSLWRGNRYLPVIFIAGLALLLTNSLISRHASLQDWIGPVMTDWMHLALSCLWLGGLCLLAFVCVPTAARHPALRAPLSAMIGRFSPLAMFCAVGLGITGVIQASSHIANLDQLFTTPYGQVLSIKVAFFLALLILGAYHQFSLMPRLRPRLLPNEKTASVVTFSLTILIELGFAVGLLVCVALLRAFA